MKTPEMQEKLKTFMKKELGVTRFIIAFSNPDALEWQTIYGEDQVWMIGAARIMQLEVERAQMTVAQHTDLGEQS